MANPVIFRRRLLGFQESAAPAETWYGPYPCHFQRRLREIEKCSTLATVATDNGEGPKGLSLIVFVVRSLIRIPHAYFFERVLVEV